MPVGAIMIVLSITEQAAAPVLYALKRKFGDTELTKVSERDMKPCFEWPMPVVEVLDELTYLTDYDPKHPLKRHLICTPWSVKNLHRMAADLGLGKHWFHKDHYDLPKRKAEEIVAKCQKVTSKEIVKIIKEGKAREDTEAGE